MPVRDQVLVVGASGVVGQAVLRHFAGLDGWSAVAVSRRRPVNVPAHQHISVDLTDRTATIAEYANAVLTGLSPAS